MNPFPTEPKLPNTKRVEAQRFVTKGFYVKKDEKYYFLPSDSSNPMQKKPKNINIDEFNKPRQGNFDNFIQDLLGVLECFELDFYVRSEYPELGFWCNCYSYQCYRICIDI